MALSVGFIQKWGQEAMCNGSLPAGVWGASKATLLLPGAGQGFECPGAHWTHRTASGQHQPSRGGQSLPGRVCWDSASPCCPYSPARFLFSGTREALRCPRNSLGARTPCASRLLCLKTLPVLIILCLPLPVTSEIRKHQVSLLLLPQSDFSPGCGGLVVRVVGCARGKCSVLAGSRAVLAAWCGISRSVGGGLKSRAGQVPGCTRMCEPQGCQLPAVSQGTVRQVSVIRFLQSDRRSLRACLYLSAWCWRHLWICGIMTFALMGKFICSALFFFLSGAQLHRCFNIILQIPTFLSFCSGTSSSGSIVSFAVSSALPSLLCQHRLLLGPFHFSKMLFSPRIFVWFSSPSLFEGLSLMRFLSTHPERAFSSVHGEGDSCSFCWRLGLPRYQPSWIILPFQMAPVLISETQSIPPNGVDFFLFAETGWLKLPTVVWVWAVAPATAIAFSFILVSGQLAVWEGLTHRRACHLLVCLQWSHPSLPASCPVAAIALNGPLLLRTGKTGGFL